MDVNTNPSFCQPILLSDNRFVSTRKPDPTPYNLIDFIAVAQKLKISFLEITWQPSRDPIGEGASGNITQAFMNLHTSLAFKCVPDARKWDTRENEIYHALISEIIAFSHPSLRRNRGVLNLEGICWDIETQEGGDDKIWPTLMVEKSPYGDVSSFLMQPVGRGLTAKDRIVLCMDLAWAISDMHMHDIVHGDIKPANALVFKKDKRYTAKLTDFGLSTRDPGQDNLVFVAGTPLWTAPELDGHYFKVAQAKNMDIFSYGLLLFWVLFEKYFSGERLLPAASRQITQSFQSEQQQPLSMTIIDQLKHGNQLTLLAKQLVRDGQDVPDDTVQVLDRFFEKALSCKPEQRMDALDILCPFKVHNQKFPLDQAILDEHNFVPSQCTFELTSSATDFYTLDFRIRRCIRQLLEQRQLVSPDPHTAFQLALCNYIGFGGPREEESLHRAIEKSGISLEELKDTAASLKPFERKEERYTGKLYNALEKSGQVAASPAAQTLQEAEAAIRQELKDLEHALGNSNRLWVINARKLAEIYESLGRWRSAQELREQLLHTHRSLLSEEHRDVLKAKQSLAHAHEHLGNHREAEELQRQVVDAKVKSLGKSHEETLKSMSHLAFMYRGTKQWDQAKELEVFIMDERMKVLGEEHEDTLHTMDSLATIYHEQDLWEKSRELWVRVVEISSRALGDEHPYTHVHKNGLAIAYRDRGYLQEAKELQEQIVKTSKKVCGEDAYRTLGSMGELARTLWRQGARFEAEDLLRQILAQTGDSMKEERFTWVVMTELGGMLNLRGKFAEAVSLHQEVLTSKMMVLGKKNSETIETMRSLARIFENQEKYAEAERIFHEIIALAEGTHTTSASQGADLRELGRILYKQGKYEQAESTFRDILTSREANLAMDPSTWNARKDLALVIGKQGRHEEAELLYRKVLTHEEGVLGKENDKTLASMHSLAENLTEQEKYVEAGKLLQEVLAIKTKIKGQDHPSTLTTANCLKLVPPTSSE